MNRAKPSLCFIALVFLLSAPIGAEDKNVSLGESYKKFLNEVHWIISDYERNAFLTLKTDQERDRFIAAFWDSRDPTPGTKANEFKDEHYRRFEYAVNYFGREAPLGWKTDRGRVYILLGKPEFVRKYSSAFELYPLELWHYVGSRGYGLPSSLYFLFYQNHGTGPYRLHSPIHDGIASLFNPHRHGEMKTEEEMYTQLAELTDPEIAHASLSAIPTQGGDPSDMFGSLITENIQAKIENARNYEVDKRTYVEDILKDRPLVQVYYSIGTKGIRNGFYWFQAPNGNFYLDYAVEYEPDKVDMGAYENEYYTSLSVNGQISTPEKIQVDQILGTHEIKLKSADLEKVKFVPFQYQGRKPIVAGKYIVTLVLSNNLSRNSVTFTDEIEVPDLSKSKTPYLTRILPIRKVEALPDDSARKFRPFQFGDKSYIPNLPAKFPQMGSIQIYHQVIFPETYNSENTVSLHYLVREANRILSESSDTLNYSSSQLAGNALDIQKDISLSKLPLGNKELVVELRQSDKVIARSNPLVFSIDREVQEGVWNLAVALPGLNSSYHNSTLAQQLLRLKRTREALGLLEVEYREHPESIQVQLQLMRVALADKHYNRVLDIGKSLEIKDPRNKELLWLLGWANYGSGQFSDAVRFLERYRLEDANRVEILNLLADSYYRLNQPDKSLERVQQSLALNPDQKDILELKKKLESSP